MDEAKFFAERLEDHGQSVASLIVNRVHPSFGDESPEGLRNRAESLRRDELPDRDAGDRLALLYENLADFRTIAEHERDNLEILRERVGDASITYVPYFARDVYDFDALHEVGRVLIGEAKSDGLA
jgi:anion-transporting  ArsA/GET3 family ATPase